MLDHVIIRKTLRVPRAEAPAGDGAVVARQLDAVLLGVGFKATGELLEHVSGLEPGAAVDLAVRVIGAVRGLVGDHVEHNAYFVDFPEGVPDTLEFWVDCLRELVGGHTGAPPAVVNLLDLPSYGRYQHTYADLLAAHDELIASAKDRVTVLHLGGTLAEETSALYLRLAGSPTPLGEADLDLLGDLARRCLDDPQPSAVPVRENRAVVNAARLAESRELIAVDTVTDVLRLACHLSDGDATLATPTRFRSFARRERRILLGALDRVVDGSGAKLGDVARHARAWKRLGEGLHPHEHPRFPHAAEVFAVARGDRTVRSLAGRAEEAFHAGDVVRAAEILTAAPGMLVRSLDRLLRWGPSDADAVLTVLASAIGSVSGRVLCSVREHLANRATTDLARVFTTRGRRAWVADDTRAPLPPDVIARATALIDAELTTRLPTHTHLVVDPAVLDIALPLSGKSSEDGFAVLPRGSRSHLDPDAGEVLRFFTYWRETAQRTDYDLSALLLDEDFAYAGHVAWTNLDHDGAVHSGDITESADGATEFIDIPLATIDAHCLIPQVNVYAVESFDDVAESMFGWMTRTPSQAGTPFEPRTVRTRSDLRGTGRVALPIAFIRTADGHWTATWLHLYLPGYPTFNQVENNLVSTGLLARAILDRKYLTVTYLLDLLRPRTTTLTTWTPDLKLTEPVTYIGLHRPDGLPEGSTLLTPDQLIPA